MNEKAEESEPAAALVKSDEQQERELRAAMRAMVTDLCKNQGVLSPGAAKILYENLWELYEEGRDEANTRE